MIAAGLPVAKDARIAVVVVPILAPIINGNIASEVKIPAAVKGIIKAIVIELLWTILVKIREVKMANMSCLPMTLLRTISALAITNVLIVFTIKYRDKKSNIKEIDSNVIDAKTSDIHSFSTTDFIKFIGGSVANFIGLVK